MITTLGEKTISAEVKEKAARVDRLFEYCEPCMLQAEESTVCYVCPVQEDRDLALMELAVLAG